MDQRGAIVYLGIISSWMLAFFHSQPLLAESPEAREQTEVKAAFIYNFTKYVTWPMAVEQSSDGLQLCVVGGGQLIDRLQSLNDRRVRNLAVKVAQRNADQRLDNCHLVYLSGAVNVEPVLERLRSKPILTVGEGESFLQAGGMIALIPTDNRIRFSVNLGQAEASRLSISSKLLQLAKRII